MILIGGKRSGPCIDQDSICSIACNWERGEIKCRDITIIILSLLIGGSISGIIYTLLTPSLPPIATTEGIVINVNVTIERNYKNVIYYRYLAIINSNNTILEARTSSNTYIGEMVTVILCSDNNSYTTNYQDSCPQNSPFLILFVCIATLFFTLMLFIGTMICGCCCKCYCKDNPKPKISDIYLI